MSFLGISFRNGYLQSWALASMINRRCKPIGTALRWLCGKLTGHPPSKTEWGYGGGGMVDVYCRWCNQPIQIPLAEADRRFEKLRGTVYSAVGRDIRQDEWAGSSPAAHDERSE
jgi:hypothetical protein